MLIIVEGVDGVGKSTFVDLLAKRLREIEPDANVTKLKAGPPEAGCEILEEYELPLQWYRPGTGEHVICDRWHIGEYIYGPMLRGKSLLDRARQLHLDMFLRSKGAVIALMASPTRAIIERRNNRNELDLIGDGEVDFVQHRYMDLLYDSKVPTSVFCWGLGSDDDLVMSAIRMGNKYEQRARELVYFPTYVGSHEPAYLLLGEKRNQNYDDRWESAFVPTPTGNSGHFMLTHLPVEGDGNVGLANATEVKLGELYSILGQPATVALGKVAHTRLLEEAIPHGAVPHPQWVRRFAHGMGDVYGRKIREAALFGEDYSAWRP